MLRRFLTSIVLVAGMTAATPVRSADWSLINLALGGAWGGPMDDAVLPQQYLIDYVRVYEAKKA